MTLRQAQMQLDRSLIGLVIDIDRVEADAVRATEFFALELIDQVRRTLHKWGAPDPKLLSTTELLAHAAAGTDLALHGLLNFGIGVNERFRFGQTPMAIEMLGLPYSGPSPFSVLLCRDKYRTKAVVRFFGVESPPGILIRPADRKLVESISDGLFPAFVKPNDLGNSIGIADNIAADRHALAHLVDRLCERFPDGVLVERFVSGVEATVMVIGNPGRAYSLAAVAADGSPLPPSYFQPFHDPQAGWLATSWRPLVDLVGPDAAKAAEHNAMVCWHALDCRDAARFDFRIDRSGKPWFIEANGQPELNASAEYSPCLNSLLGGDDDSLIEAYLAAFFQRIDAFVKNLNVRKTTFGRPRE
jgi:D-alanine-D-alanine ligase